MQIAHKQPIKVKSPDWTIRASTNLADAHRFSCRGKAAEMAQRVAHILGTEFKSAQVKHMPGLNKYVLVITFADMPQQPMYFDRLELK